MPAIEHTYNIIVTGVGGTGVVTIGGILGMAAHLEGKGVGVLDMAGLAQKGGAVFSHIRFAEKPEDIHAIRVAAGRADLVLGGDIVVAGTQKVLATVKTGATKVIVNTDAFLPGEFTRNADFSLPTERLKRTIVTDAGRDNAHFIDASRIANALFGQSIGANMFMVGYAYQLGAIPLSGRGDREGNRAQWRGGRHEQGGLPLGPPRRARPRRGRGAGEAKGRGRERRGASVGIVRRDGRAAGEIPHRLSECRLCAALPGAGRQGEGCGGGPRARQVRACRRRRALSVQADGL